MRCFIKLHEKPYEWTIDNGELRMLLTPIATGRSVIFNFQFSIVNYQLK